MSKHYLYDTLNEGILDLVSKAADHFLNVIYSGHKKDFIANTLKNDPILVKAMFDLNATIFDFSASDFDKIKKFLDK